MVDRSYQSAVYVIAVSEGAVDRDSKRFLSDPALSERVDRGKVVGLSALRSVRKIDRPFDQFFVRCVCAVSGCNLLPVYPCG